MKIVLNKEQIQALSLKDSGINGRERAKGEAIEEICRQVLLLQGADEVYSYEELDEQINVGDLKYRLNVSLVIPIIGLIN